MRAPRGLSESCARSARFAFAAAFALAAGAASAAARPAVLVGAGSTFAVLGDPSDGGLTTALSLLWPVDAGVLEPGSVRFGVTGFADDLGSALGPLVDPAQPSVVLGTTVVAHRLSWGVAWRMDAGLPARKGWTPVASGTWGYYHVADDQWGEVLSAVRSTGFSLGGGLRHALRKGTTVGAMVRYHRLFNDTAGRYASAGVECGW
jgi:hypothetical protein